jgi:hypothetical protein
MKNVSTACAFVPAAADLTASCLKSSGLSTNSRRFSTVNSTEINFENFFIKNKKNTCFFLTTHI